jgi:peptide/nickel transport system permease protein
MQLAPGDYFTKLQMNPEISKETVSQLRSKFGFDKPLIVQYLKWLQGILHLDFGTSLVYQIPVFTLIKERLFNTLLLSIIALLVIWIISIPLGIWCATNQYKWLDQLLSGLSFIGISLPSFFFGFLLLYLASNTGILPTGGIIDLAHNEYSIWGKFIDYSKHLVIPVTILTFVSVVGMLRIMRANMLDELHMPYITTARAKGLSEPKTIYKHALRNAINPMVTIFGYELSSLLSGAALTEIILSWPGMGRLMLDALLQQDLYLVMASLFVSSVLLIFGNFIADILLAIIDPRIRQ